MEVVTRARGTMKRRAGGMAHTVTLRIRTEMVAPWLAFGAMLLWSWRVWDIVHNVPAYQDVLEIAWGIEWYWNTLVVHQSSPAFTTQVFHPFGWYVFTFGYTPTLFLLALPLTMVGGVAFAHNVLALGSLVAAFAGGRAFAKLYTRTFAATIAALVFTFADFRFFRVAGHLNLALTTCLLPWFLWSLERLRRAEGAAGNSKLIVLCGLFWGLMINFALYGIFFGLICFVIWGRDLLKLELLTHAAKILLLALLISAPVIVLYATGKSNDRTATHDIMASYNWSASLNSLFIPSVVHPFKPIRDLSRTLYTGAYDESGMANVGFVTLILGLIGIGFVMRGRKGDQNLLWLTMVGLILALGITLRWNGEAITSSLFNGVNWLLWNIGHQLKSDVFSSAQPFPPLDMGVPLPGFVLAATVPFWEAARVMSRYVFIGGIGLIMLAAIGLQRLPKLPRYLLACVWLIESLPVPTANAPLATNPHPAFTWIAKQRLGAGEGIVDLAGPSLGQGGEIIYATKYHQTPTAATVGSSWPATTMQLWDFFLQEENLAAPDMAFMLEQYRVRYLVLHLRDASMRQRWNILLTNPSFRAEGCFAPLAEESPWPYPICVAEINRLGAPGIHVLPQEGWSFEDPTSLWAIDVVARARWLATSQDRARLIIEAQPHCMPAERQEMAIVVNGVELATHTWDQCETLRTTIGIPESLVRKGWNTLTFRYAYTAEVGDDRDGSGTPKRAVAFRQLRVEPVDR